MQFADEVPQPVTVTATQPLAEPRAPVRPRLAFERLVSLDAFRGLIMITLAGAGFGFAQTANQLGFGPDAEVESTAGRVWQSLAFHTQHPAWVSQFHVIGCSYWDLIQPAFMFMVGVAMPFSYARRSAEGQSTATMWIHAVKRAVILVLLGVFLQSQRGPQTNWLFTNVLSQIGLGYLVVLGLLNRGVIVQLIAAALILVGYWLAFVLYPAPGPDFDFAAVGIDSSWLEPGYAAHFTKNANVAAAFDRWFLNLFPRPEIYAFHPGGYATLNFVPSIVTMLFGAMAGQLLRGSLHSAAKFGILLLTGCIFMGLAVWAGDTVCPIVKRIWSPSWTLYSGAWIAWILAAFYLVVDVFRLRAWTYPLVVVGVNSILIYLMSQMLKPWTARMLKIHVGQDIFSGPYAATIQALSVLAVFWLICWWLYRQKLFVRI